MEPFVPMTKDEGRIKRREQKEFYKKLAAAWTEVFKDSYLPDGKDCVYVSVYLFNEGRSTFCHSFKTICPTDIDILKRDDLAAQFVTKCCECFKTKYTLSKGTLIFSSYHVETPIVIPNIQINPSMEINNLSQLVLDCSVPYFYNIPESMMEFHASTYRTGRYYYDDDIPTHVIINVRTESPALNIEATYKFDSELKNRREEDKGQYSKIRKDAYSRDITNLIKAVKKWFGKPSSPVVQMRALFISSSWTDILDLNTENEVRIRN